MTHTSGPWIIDDRHPDTIRSASGTVIAVFDNGNKEHNARMAAASPAMLEFIREIARRDPVFAKGWEKQHIKDAQALVHQVEGR